MTNVVPMRKDGKPTVPVCVNCESFRPHTGIGSPAYCYSPKRKSDFDPVYGWQQVSMRASDARADNCDCGMAGNFYQEKINDPLSLMEPASKPTYWSRLKRWLRC